MKIIGLTGGIGSGKSTVSDYLREKGFDVVDADEISHKVTEIGSPTLDKIRESFGDDYFLEDGSLDRKKMAALVFGSPEHKTMLESIITTEIFRQMRTEINRLSSMNPEPKAVFLDVPLLFESGADKMVDESWLVTADLEARIERVMARDGVRREQVLERVANQMSTEEKARLADYTIDNSKGREELYRNVEALIEKNVN